MNCPWLIEISEVCGLSDTCLFWCYLFTIVLWFQIKFLVSFGCYIQIFMKPGSPLFLNIYPQLLPAWNHLQDLQLHKEVIWKISLCLSRTLGKESLMFGSSEGTGVFELWWYFCLLTSMWSFLCCFMEKKLK